MNSSNLSTRPAARNGYDLPIYGLTDNKFISIHAPALTAIFLSLISVIILLISSFVHQSIRTFFRWSKPERFVVYLALCDGLFNLCHSMDHLHILITKDHVYPLELCVFYGVMLIEFITAQHIMVMVICINAFLLVFYEKNIEFGVYDWKLLSWVFGIPAVIAIVSAGLGILGPNGNFCYFDRVKGNLANTYFTTIPVVIVLMLDIILYTLTWWRIRMTEPKFDIQSNIEVHRIRASHRAARNMSLFVIAFVIQWWSSVFFGLWLFMNKKMPHVIFQFATIFPNIGGILNLIVYFIIRRRMLMHKAADSECSPIISSVECPKKNLSPNGVGYTRKMFASCSEDTKEMLSSESNETPADL